LLCDFYVYFLEKRFQGRFYSPNPFCGANIVIIFDSSTKDKPKIALFFDFRRLARRKKAISGRFT